MRRNDVYCLGGDFVRSLVCLGKFVLIEDLTERLPARVKNDFGSPADFRSRRDRIKSAPGRNRTHNRRIRSPAELQAGFQPQDYL